MLELLQAIQTKFDGTGAITATFPKGLYLYLAPNAQALPAAVLNFVSSVPEDENTGKIQINKPVIQFNVYFKNDALGAATAIKTIKANFDNWLPTLTNGLTCIRNKRRNEQMLKEDDTVFHAYVEYEFWIEEQLP